MTDIVEVRDAIAHINDCTGDPAAWRQGLTPADVSVLLPAAVIDNSVLTGLLVTIRRNHPALFDPTTGVPITPPARPVPAPPPTEQQGQLGEAATAIKKAEDDLAQQNSTAAQVDLHVITAILNAHAVTVDGGGALQTLQRDVENAVRSRTDLDTPAGARDFQRYLIDRLREIGAVVETAHLDDTSKAALASAWTALYESARTATGPATAPASSPARSTQPAEPALPAYGADTPAVAEDPLLDQLLGGDLGPQPGWPGADAGAAPTSPLPTGPPPAIPLMSGAPPFGGGAPAPGGGAGSGLPGPLGVPRMDERPPESPSDRSARDPSLEELLRDEGLLDGPETSTAETTSVDEEAEAEEASPEQATTSGPTEVHLPGGDTVVVSNPRIAKVIEAAVAGTPIGDAFRQQGITVPPPGTAVAHPLDPGRIGSGDIGMFSDRQALALDRSHALFNGRIQPVTSVSGPSFLGWLHPPGPDTTTPSASSPTTAPENSGSPQPTRPATSSGPTG
ncbi:DUF4226 domain-containing protein [soil metagenome]